MALSAWVPHRYAGSPAPVGRHCRDGDPVRWSPIGHGHGSTNSIGITGMVAALRREGIANERQAHGPPWEAVPPAKMG
jgi:hypothetical protein